MSDTILRNDKEITASDIRGLNDIPAIIHFFNRLGYAIRENTPIDHLALNLDTPEFRHLISEIHHIATDPYDEDEIHIYVFVVTKITDNLRQKIARRFRDSSQRVLFVLATPTTDYDALEFVFLERSRRGMNLTLTPLSLQVDLKNLDEIILQILPKLTVTEADADAQWKKLQQTYLVDVEWRDVYFTNRALFSDYYLKNRLPDAPEWRDEALISVMQFVRNLIDTQQANTSHFYLTLFDRLGFDARPNTPKNPDEIAPTYSLYAKNDPSKPIAHALTYDWERHLDAPDDRRDSITPREEPSSWVVSLLEQQAVPWVILTNGKLWRLYSTSISDKSTNYYEVDLSVSLDKATPNWQTAFKYWWLMFRASAFTGFLDTVMQGSEDYAKGIRENLKSNIFEEIFPEFAQGFIKNMKTHGNTDFDEDQLADVFNATMFFLYRLMFILYAESLELLPVQAETNYQTFSLYRLKKEIAEVAGELKRDFIARNAITTYYDDTSTALYDRLKELFTFIDVGSSVNNIPTYNGGLFSPKTPEGQFLATYAIPDRFLAVGLDNLTRDTDEKTGLLEFIDFKSLGVRQLGSIYEGLLEFKLRIATQRLEIVKEKGKEVYIPHAKATDPNKIIEKGIAYLENDKRERKASGSYYTPDYIVKYIVQHTVGPILERKFEALRPRIRTAQADYRDYQKLVEARKKSHGKAESADVFWQSDTMRHLADDCLNIRVLDPAMGSGHFLVEVVDFISNRLNDFLNGWSENPVWALLHQTKADILADMKRQGVDIDQDQLTRVALLKRAVLKRCAYGVDLNPMAVELAKVSLWLNAFTLGAPLSFLDHHLKCGNSLIGARIADVQAYLRGGESATTVDMFSGNEFAGVMLGTDLMRQVSFLSDNTIAEVEQSKDAYANALGHLAPYKRLLDVYVSRWFGNPPTSETGKKKKSKADNLLLFLKDATTATWLKNPDMPLDDTLLPATHMAQIATTASAQKHFFHWELEFPEIFFAPSTPGGTDVRLLDDGGFDAVVGNPPWGAEMDNSDKILYQTLFNKFHQRTPDTSKYFIGHNLRLLYKGAYLGIIVPNNLMYEHEYLNVRIYLVEETSLYSVINMGDMVFDEVVTPSCILVTQNLKPLDSHKFSISDLRFLTKNNIDEIKTQESSEISINELKNIPGLVFLNNSQMATLINRLFFEATQPLSELVDEIAAGIGTGGNEAYILSKQEIDALSVDSLYSPTVIVGGDIEPYGISNSGNHILYITRDFPIKNYPKVMNHLLKFKPRLEKKRETRNGILPWYSLHWARYRGLFETTKIVCRQTSDTLIASVDNNFNYTINSVINIILSPNVEISYQYLCTLLNSSLMRFIYSNLVQEEGRIFAEVKPINLRKLPIRRIDFSTPADERRDQTESLIRAYQQAVGRGGLAWSVRDAQAYPSDVIHDFLAYLAERMIELNKQKQAETSRFLAWVMKTARLQKDLTIEDLKGKTILQGYLGDYQKGESETTWKAFRYRLTQNQRSFSIPLSEVEELIEDEYERSLKVVLRPIKSALAQTDTLIDNIVYRLYGLSDDDIELIERPQYQQALADAKKEVAQADDLADEERVEQFSEGILTHSRRYFMLLDPQDVARRLDDALPTWRILPSDAPVSLLTGEYNLNMPDGLDFSFSISAYAKAVEVAVTKRIFEPFRDQYTEADCNNPVLKQFMQYKTRLTLGNFIFILPSSDEPTLRNFVAQTVSNLAELLKLFRQGGHIGTKRNNAVHNTAFAREDVLGVREWALAVLRAL